MRDRDYVWCLTHMALDQEEELARLCPSCRLQAEEARCPVCGRPAESWEGALNPSFDRERYERAEEGGTAMRDYLEELLDLLTQEDEEAAGGWETQTVSLILPKALEAEAPERALEAAGGSDCGRRGLR